MTIWANEIKDLDKLYLSFKGHLPDIVKEMEQLIKTDDANVVMLYSRRCLEVIVTDLCETELGRPRKTEPLKGIIDKLNSEEKVPAHIITSMISLNSMATYGAHPKDFDPEQVKPVLNNLAIIIKWYLKYKDFQIVSKSELIEPVQESRQPETPAPSKPSRRRPVSMKKLKPVLFTLLALIVVFVVVRSISAIGKAKEAVLYMSIDAYKTVTIGDQVWMAENLKTTMFNDGTPIPMVKDNIEWESLTTPAYSWYENDRKTYGDTYGPLYNWFAVNTGKLCPAGWHVPSDAEWEALTYFVGDSVDTVEWYDRGVTDHESKEVAGSRLKEAGNAHWDINDSISATDEFGFGALPGGIRTIDGAFFDAGHQGSWWSATGDYDERDAKNREMYSNTNSVTAIQQNKQMGLSVRCIKDITVTDVDTNNYTTVWIGNQLWMAENLRTTRLNDGTPIPKVTGDTLLWNWETKSPSYSYIGENEDAYYETYGRLYSWYTVNTGKLCPIGWRVPTDDEWTIMTDYLGGESVAGGKLKEAGTVHWISPNTGGTNETGFGALPGGYGPGTEYEGERGINFGYGSYFWSSTSDDSDARLHEGRESNIAWRRELYTYSSKVERYIEGKANGLSVRCIKD